MQIAIYQLAMLTSFFHAGLPERPRMLERFELFMSRSSRALFADSACRFRAAPPIDHSAGQVMSKYLLHYSVRKVRFHANSEGMRDLQELLEARPEDVNELDDTCTTPLGACVVWDSESKQGM